MPVINKKLARSSAILRCTHPNATCIIAPLTGRCRIAFQNLYNATLFFRFGIRFYNGGYNGKEPGSGAQL